MLKFVSRLSIMKVDSLNHLNDGVVERILVLLKPAGQIVRYGRSVVDDSKVRIRVRPLDGLSWL